MLSLNIFKGQGAHLRNMFFYGSSIAVMKGISLIMLPFLANVLAVEEMGRIELVATISAFVSVFVAFGLEDTFYKYCGRTENKSRVAAEIYGLACVLALVFYCIFSILSFSSFLSNYLGLTPLDLNILCVTLALEGMISTPLSWLRMQGKAGSFFLIVVGRVVLQASLTLLFIEENSTVTDVLMIGLAAALTQVSVLSFVHLRLAGIRFTLHRYIKYLGFGWPILFVGLTGFLVNGIDKFFISQLYTFELLAIYGVTCKFAIALILLMQPFGMWWRPIRFTALQQKGKKYVANVIEWGVLYLAGCSLLVLLVGPFLIDYLLPLEYQAAKYYLSGMVIVYFLRESCELYNLGCLNAEQSRSYFKINLYAALVGTPIILCFTYYFGLWGCIVGLGLTQSLRLVLIYLKSQQLMPLPFSIYRYISLLSLAIIYSLIVANLDSVIVVAVTLFVLMCVLIGTFKIPRFRDFFPALKINQHA